MAYIGIFVPINSSNSNVEVWMSLIQNGRVLLLQVTLQQDGSNNTDGTGNKNKCVLTNYCGPLVSAQRAGALRPIGPCWQC